MKASFALKAAVVVLTIVSAPIIGIMTTPKREATAKAAEEGPTAEQQQAAASAGQAKAVATSNFVGVLLPPQMATMSSYAEGRVESVEVKLGQRVQKGQRLMRLDPRAKEQELKAAEGALLAAQGAAGAAGSELAAASQRLSR